MSALYRFGVSLDKQLIDSFDQYIKTMNYSNRSEAIRDLIREKLIQKKRDENGQVAGAIIMTYDHHKRELVEKLMDVQHDFHETIISTQHVHLDHDHCLEIIAVSGAARDVERLAAKLKAFIGVKRLSVSISAYGVDEKQEF
jgi:CopG family transcriptional regulator, nickel-responsive regulator